MKDLLKQMQGYKIVLTRGFPFKFTSLAQFNRFKKSLLNGLKKVGIPIEDVRIQGSSLRKAPPMKAKDVDLVVFIEDHIFNDYLRKAFSYKIKLNGVKLNLSKMSDINLTSLAQDISLDLSKKKYNSLGRTFSNNFDNRKISALTNKPRIIGQEHRDLVDLINKKYPDLKIEDISIQTIGGSLNLKPDMILN